MLDDAACTRKKALAAWDKVFNTDFFSQREASKRPSHRPTAAALASSVMVISNSARTGGVAEEGWDVFTSGQAWKEEGHPGKLTSWEVLYRARSAGSRPYNAFTWNCESFVAYCHGLPSASPQLAVAVVVALVGAAIIARS